MGLKKIADSQDFQPFGNEMYVNPIRLMKSE